MASKTATDMKKASRTETKHSTYEQQAKDIVGEQLINLLFNKRFASVFLAWESLSKSEYISERLVEKYIDAPWNWGYMSVNPNITCEFVEKHLDKPWDWCWRSEHASLNFILNHPDLTWNWERVASRKFVIDFIENGPPLGTDWYPISRIRRHVLSKNGEWNWRKISFKENLAPGLFDKYPDKPWNMAALTRLSTITCAFIDKHPERNWDWSILADKKDFTLEFVKRHLAKPFDWDCFSLNDNFTLDIIEKYKDKICPQWALYNKNLTMEYYKKLENDGVFDDAKPGSLYSLSINPGITMRDIENNLDVEWSWNAIAQNPNITYEFIKKYYHKFPDKSYLVRSPNFTIEDIKDMEPEVYEYIDYSKKFTKMYDDALHSLYKKDHKNMMTQLLNELNCVIYHPDNLEFLMANGFIVKFGK